MEMLLYVLLQTSYVISAVLFFLFSYLCVKLTIKALRKYFSASLDEKITLDENDRALRNHWLALTAVFVFFPFALILTVSLLLTPRDLFTLNVLIILAVPFGIKLSVFFSFYYFCYRQNGLKFLTFVLCTAPLILVRDLWLIFNAEGSILAIAGTLSGTALFIWWYFQSLKLFKVNQKIKKINLEFNKSISLNVN